MKAVKAGFNLIFSFFFSYCKHLNSQKKKFSKKMFFHFLIIALDLHSFQNILPLSNLLAKGKMLGAGGHSTMRRMRAT